MFKKIKFIAGVALIAQGFGFIISSFASARRKGHSGVFVESGFLCALIGGVLVLSHLRDEHKLDRFFSALDGDYDDYSDITEIPIDDSASEEEFTD